MAVDRARHLAKIVHDIRCGGVFYIELANGALPVNEDSPPVGFMKASAYVASIAKAVGEGILADANGDGMSHPAAVEKGAARCHSSNDLARVVESGGTSA